MDDKHAIEQSHRDESCTAAVGEWNSAPLCLSVVIMTRSIIWISNLNLIFRPSKSQKWMNIVLVLEKKGAQNLQTLLQYLHCEEYFISGYNKFHYNFPTNPPVQIAKECVYIWMNLFKSFFWQVDSELKAFVMYRVGCLLKVGIWVPCSLALILCTSRLGLSALRQVSALKTNKKTEALK